MGHVQVLVDVVVAEGQLGVDVSLAGDGSVQLVSDSGDLVGIQQIQRGNVLLVGNASLLSQLSQGVLESLGVQGLMVGVGAGVDDGDPGAGTGVAGSPGSGGADLSGRGSHVGIVDLVSLDDVGLVAGLDQDLADALDSLDGSDLAVLDVGGDHVGSQGQVPDHIQLAADGLLDGSGGLGLLILQVGTVGHSLGIGGDGVGGETSHDGGLVLQENGHTDHVGVDVVAHGVQVIVGLGQQVGGDGTVVDLGEADLACRSGGDRGSQAQQHAESHNQGQQALVQMLHMGSSFCFLLISQLLYQEHRSLIYMYTGINKYATSYHVATGKSSVFLFETICYIWNLCENVPYFRNYSD